MSSNSAIYGSAESDSVWFPSASSYSSRTAPLRLAWGPISLATLELVAPFRRGVGYLNALGCVPHSSANGSHKLPPCVTLGLVLGTQTGFLQHCQFLAHGVCLPALAMQAQLERVRPAAGAVTNFGSACSGCCAAAHEGQSTIFTSRRTTIPTSRRVYNVHMKENIQD